MGSWGGGSTPDRACAKAPGQEGVAGMGGQARSCAPSSAVEGERVGDAGGEVAQARSRGLLNQGQILGCSST